MSPIRAFQVFAKIFYLGLIVLFAIIGAIGTIYHDISTQSQYRQKYGENWQAEYENVYGSLEKIHTRDVICVIGPLALMAVLIWLYRILKPAKHRKSRSRGEGGQQPKRGEGTLEYIARCRRNAVIGIVFGFIGIAIALLLVLFHVGVFRDHADEVVLGLFVFVCGYGSVIGGCWWWVKAKHWNDAVVFIGLMPLTPMLIPYVRLFLLKIPTLLFACMIMMSAILTVVVAVLPDKSAWNKRKRWRMRKPASDSSDAPPKTPNYLS